MKDEKCRFFYSCPLVQSEGYTCNNQEEASSEYCGRYRENEDIEFRIKWK